MAGITHNNVVGFSNFNFTRAFSLHNLGGQSRMLTGHIGRVDGSHQRNATVNFYGDGTLLQSLDLVATDMPTPISIFVEGVHQLRVEVNFDRRAASGVTSRYSLSAFLE